MERGWLGWIVAGNEAKTDYSFAQPNVGGWIWESNEARQICSCIECHSNFSPKGPFSMNCILAAYYSIPAFWEAVYYSI